MVLYSPSHAWAIKLGEMMEKTMQTIHDLTDEEIAGLTDDQVNMFIDVECARKGAPLLPLMPVEPEKPTAEPDKNFYGVSGLWFATAAEAAEVLAAITKHQPYTYEWRGNQYVAKRGAQYQGDEVSTKKMFSPEHYETHRKVLEKYEADKKLYDSEKKRFDEALGKRSENTQEVWDIVSRAREIKSERAQIQRTYDRYLELAKGDKGIAFDFLNTSIGTCGYEHDHSEFLKTIDPRPQEE
jgi:hypothetical protein